MCLAAYNQIYINMGTITDILTDKQFTKTLTFTFCLFNDGCDSKSEALKATIYKGSIALIFFKPRLTVR